ncbi:hypothetical protein PSN45_000856 [Yamadazyma tenuis]|uniref:uncharacterized protein n=1 Tax=Candida tenuis TaxID=2315449 RepID=UPI0027A22D5D|nr:hypothetical protein PSN45_000856 [Yamadazyma tenuis]
MVQTNVEKLAVLSNQWKNGVPKNWKSQFVGQVHEIVKSDPSPANLSYLSHTRYFDHVLWPYFNPDVTEAHVELMAVMCLYELQHPQRLGWALRHATFNAFFVRLLNITFGLKKDANFRLHRVCIMLMKRLVELGWRPDVHKDLVAGNNNSAFGPDYLMKNWLKDLLLKNIDLSYENDGGVEYDTYLRAVLSWSAEVKKIESLNFPFECFNSDITGIKPYLQPLVSSRGDMYPAFLRLYYKTYELSGTTYDVKDDLDVLSTDFEEVVSKLELGFSGLAKSAVLHGLKVRLIQSKLDFNDSEVFYDVYESMSPFKFALPILSQTEYRIFTHLAEVLQRVKITLDKSKNLKIGGKSKYFSHVETRWLKSACVLSKVECDIGETLLLLEVSKPNKYSDVPRVNKFGIETLVVVEVISKNQNGVLVEPIRTQTKLGASCERFNYFVKVPKFLQPSINLQYTHTTISLNRMSFEGFVPGAIPLRANKKRSDGTHIVDVNLTEETVTYKAEAAKALNKIQSTAVYRALTKSVNLIDTPPHSGSMDVLNAILKNINRNFKGERTLVVFPHTNWVKRYEPPAEITKVSASFEKMEDPIKVIEDLLEETKQVSGMMEMEHFTLKDALFFFEYEVPRRWKQFLHSLEKDSSTKYPFGEVEGDLNQIMDAHHKLLDIYDNLRKASSVLGFENNEHKVKQLMMSAFSKFVFVAAVDLAKLQGKFDNVICFESQFLCNLTVSHPKRLVVMGDFTEATDQSVLWEMIVDKDVERTRLNIVRTSEDIFKLYSNEYNVELNSIKIKGSALSYRKSSSAKTNVNVAEAEKCADISISIQGSCIATASLYQEALLKEMSTRVETVDELTFHGTIILSMHGVRTVEDVLKCAKRCDQLVMVGDTNVMNVRETK